jgi:membrane fusion protein (multidrug efflux system)
MRRNFVAAASLISCALAPLACKPQQAPAAGAIPVQVAEVVQRDVPIKGEWIGTTEGTVDAEIRAQVSGYLTGQDYQEGHVVKKGDLLFTIDARPLRAALEQARGDLGRASAQLQKTRQDVARFTPLAKEGAVSQRELDDAIQANRAAEAQVQTAKAAVEKARLDVEFAQIRSPIDGVAGTARRQLGELVGPSDPQPLTTVSQVDPIRVSFPLAERDYLRFADRVNQVAAGGDQAAQNTGLELFLADGSQYPSPGRVIMVNREIDQRTGTIQVKGAFPNPNHTLRPGQYARVRAIIDVRKQALLVPERAVSDLQGMEQVAVVGPDNKIELRTVQAGPTTDGLRVIEKGLAPGDRVVVEGLQKVRAGVTVEPKPVGG